MLFSGVFMSSASACKVTQKNLGIISEVSMKRSHGSRYKMDVFWVCLLSVKFVRRLCIMLASDESNYPSSIYYKGCAWGTFPPGTLRGNCRADYLAHSDHFTDLFKGESRWNLPEGQISFKTLSPQTPDGKCLCPIWTAIIGVSGLSNFSSLF